MYATVIIDLWGGCTVIYTGLRLGYSAISIIIWLGYAKCLDYGTISITVGVWLGWATFNV